MYKLTVIAGPNRGTSYPVNSGEISVGRQSGNTITLASSKVSKRHCVFLVNQNEVVVRDEGSSNGTFVNGILTKLKKLHAGDKISIGEFVFELVEPPKRINKPLPVSANMGNPIQLDMPNFGGLPQAHASAPPLAGGITGIGQNIPAAQQTPKDLKGRVIWIFENQIMPYFYNLNTKNEWRMISIGLFGLFLLGNVVVTVYPLLESNRVTLMKETGARARFMAKQIAEQNAPFLAAHAETKTEIGMIENAEGVRLALLLDMDSRIIAPGSKMNQYFSSGSEALIAVKARENFLAGRETGYWIESDNLVVAVEPVKVLSPTLGKNVVVAMAVVSIDTSISTPDVGEMGMVYSETVILTGILGGIILLILYKLTLKPFQVLNEDMDKALKGELSQVSHSFKIEELNSLWEIINSAVQRIPRGGSDSGNNLGNSIDAGPTIEQVSGPLRMLGDLGKFGMILLDADQRVVYLNSNFEELSGIRSDSSMGQLLSDVARDQAMSAFTSDLAGRVSTGSEGVSEDYDFSGVSHKVYAAGFGSPGTSPKCFLFIAVRNDG